MLSGNSILDVKKRRHYSGFDTILGPDTPQVIMIGSRPVFQPHWRHDHRDAFDCGLNQDTVYTEAAQTLVREANANFTYPFCMHVMFLHVCMCVRIVYISLRVSVFVCTCHAIPYRYWTDTQLLSLRMAKAEGGKHIR